MTLPELFAAFAAANDALDKAEFAYQQARAAQQKAVSDLGAALQGIRTAMQQVQGL